MLAPDREDALDATQEITRHPVGAAHQDDGFPTGILKAEQATVLQEASEDAADADVLALARDTRDEATDAPDHEVYLHAGLRGLVEGLDDVGVDQAVHLREDGRLPAVLRRRGFRIDEVDDAAMEMERRHQEVLELRLGQIPRQDVEEQAHVGRDFLVGREQGEVRVEPRGLGIVVAGAEMGIATETALFLAHHQAGLAMGLQAREAIDDVGAGFLQLAGPFDVVEFIETGAQFDQGGDLLAIPGRFLERFDDRRITAGAVERQLDRDDRFIPRRLPEEVDDGVEGLVGVMEEEIVFRDAAVKLLRVREVGRKHRSERWVQQIRPADQVDQAA